MWLIKNFDNKDLLLRTRSHINSATSVLKLKSNDSVSEVLRKNKAKKISGNKNAKKQHSFFQQSKKQNIKFAKPTYVWRKSRSSRRNFKWVF